MGPRNFFITLLCLVSVDISVAESISDRVDRWTAGSAGDPFDNPGKVIVDRKTHVEIIDHDVVRINCMCGNSAAAKVVVEEVTIDETRTVVGRNGETRTVHAHGTYQMNEAIVSTMRVPVRPGANYRYRLADEDNSWKFFKVPPPPDAKIPLKVIMVSALVKKSSLKSTCETVTKTHQQEPIDAVILVGDSEEASRARFLDDCSGLPWFATKNGKNNLQFMDSDSSLDSSFDSLLTDEGGLGRMSSASFGPAKILTLDPSQDTYEGSPQMQWLEKQLKSVNASTTPHVLVLAHKTMEEVRRRKCQFSPVNKMLSTARSRLVDSHVKFIFTNSDGEYLRNGSDLNEVALTSEKDEADDASVDKSSYEEKDGTAFTRTVWAHLELHGQDSHLVIQSTETTTIIDDVYGNGSWFQRLCCRGKAYWLVIPLFICFGCFSSFGVLASLEKDKKREHNPVSLQELATTHETDLNVAGSIGSFVTLADAPDTETPSFRTTSTQISR